MRSEHLNIPQNIISNLPLCKYVHKIILICIPTSLFIFVKLYFFKFHRTIEKWKKPIRIRMNQHESITDITSANVFETRYSIECINDDCLLYICKYLEFLDVVNLAATCTRLLEFAIDYVFPKKAKKLRIELYPKCLLPAILSFHTASSIVAPKSLEASLRYYHEFVEYLEISIPFCAATQLAVSFLKHFENLSSLSFEGKFLTSEIFRAIDRLQHLKELNLIGTYSFVNDWTASSRTISSVEKLSVCARDTFSINFFEHFRHLSSLTVELYATDWSSEDLLLIFELYGNCLEHLRIIGYFDCIDSEYIAMLISDKLLKLNRLDFRGSLRADSMFIIKMQHLKYLNIVCLFEKINPILQALNDNGIVEDLAIHGGYYEEDTNSSPLIFNELQSLILNDITNSTNLLKSLTGTQMPRIHTFRFHNEENPAEVLLKFCESKKTLKSIRKAVEYKPCFIIEVDSDEDSDY